MTKNLDTKGLRSVLINYDLFFIDLWGVIHNGIELYKDAVDVLEKLSEAKNQSIMVLERAVSGIAELITKPGEINLDFADVKSVMSNAGSTMMGSGIAEGIDRAEDATQQAIDSPLLDNIDVKDAKGLLINITSDGSLTSGEFKTIGKYIGDLVDEDEGDVFVGTSIDESLGEKLKVTIVATGMNNVQSDANIIKPSVDIVLETKNEEIEEEWEIIPESICAIEDVDLISENEVIIENEYDQQEEFHEEIELPNYSKQDEYVAKLDTNTNEIVMKETASNPIVPSPNTSTTITVKTKGKNFKRLLFIETSEPYRSRYNPPNDYHQCT